MHKLNRERALRYLAKDVPDYKRVFVDRNDLLEDFEYSHQGFGPPDLVASFLKHWLRMMEIKHEGRARVVTLDAQYDIDFNRYLITGRIR